MVHAPFCSDHKPVATCSCGLNVQCQSCHWGHGQAPCNCRPISEPEGSGATVEPAVSSAKDSLPNASTGESAVAPAELEISARVVLRKYDGDQMEDPAEVIVVQDGEIVDRWTKGEDRDAPD